MNMDNISTALVTLVVFIAAWGASYGTARLMFSQSNRRMGRLEGRFAQGGCQEHRSMA